MTRRPEQQSGVAILIARKDEGEVRCDGKWLEKHSFAAAEPTASCRPLVRQGLPYCHSGQAAKRNLPAA